MKISFIIAERRAQIVDLRSINNLKTVINTLLRASNALKDMRGITYQYHEVDLRVTYHPAAILRNMGMYDLLKNDMQELVEKYNKDVRRKT